MEGFRSPLRKVAPAPFVDANRPKVVEEKIYRPNNGYDSGLLDRLRARHEKPKEGKEEIAVSVQEVPFAVPTLPGMPINDVTKITITVSKAGVTLGTLSAFRRLNDQLNPDAGQSFYLKSQNAMTKGQGTGKILMSAFEELIQAAPEGSLGVLVDDTHSKNVDKVTGKNPLEGWYARRNWKPLGRVKGVLYFSSKKDYIPTPDEAKSLSMVRALVDLAGG